MRVDQAFAELYGREFEAVFRSVYALFGSREMAEDATQEAFARALERWSRLRGRSWAGGWVMTTALNVARKAAPRRRAAEPPAEAARDIDSSVDVWRAVRNLPARQQEAVVLYYASDLSVAEVAQAMRCAEGTVKAHLAKAREALRPQLDEVRDA